MKKLLLSIVLLLTTYMGFGQCPPSAVFNFSSQAEIDQFGIDFPNCVNFLGDLIIEGDDITDLSPLSAIETVSLVDVGGFVTIRNNPQLETLDGFNLLRCLEVEISGNAILQDVSAFSDLFSFRISDFLTSALVSGNPLLSDCAVNFMCDADVLNVSGNGLGCESEMVVRDTCMACGESPFILNSQAAVNAFAANNPLCTRLTNDLIISGADIVDLSPLNTIVQVENLIIENNPLLETLDGLENISRISNGTLTSLLRISGNPLLTNMEGLSNMSSIRPADIVIENNPLIQNLLGLSQMVNISNLSIKDNDNFTSFLGLHPDASFTSLEVVNNDLLTSFESFNNKEVTCSVTIGENELLADIYDIAMGGETFNCSDGRHLEIINNPNLEDCDTAFVCDNYLEFSSITVENNAGNCTDETAVFLTCTVCPNADITLASQQQIDDFAMTYPNCADIRRRITISGPDITNVLELSQIETLNKQLTIEDNPLLTSLEGLSLTFTETDTAQNLNILRIFNNPLLTSLGSFGSMHMRDIVLRDNFLLEDLSGLENMQGEISRIILDDLDTINDLDGLQGITHILVDLEVNKCDSLTTLEGLDPLSIDDISLTNNPNLVTCSLDYVCAAIFDMDPSTSVTILNNGPNCNSQSEVIALCAEMFNVISGNVSFDVGNNECANGVIDASSILVEMTDGTSTVSSLTNEDGNYLLFANFEGIVTTRIVEESLPDNFNSASDPVDIDFDGLGNEVTINHCIGADSPFNDLRITFVPLEEARPGFDTVYILFYENVGTTALSGQVTLTFDDTRQQFLNASPVQDDIQDNVLSWDFVNLLPFQSESIIIEFNNFPPPTNDADDILNFTATITPVDGDDTPDDNTSIVEQIIVNSFDPNDKAVVQGEGILIEEVGEYLDYLVRFQNIGTASAINVRVEDVLSDNLDWSTIRILDASHDYELQIEDDNKLIFFFNDIFLPPEEQDEEGSNGHIAFQVRTNTNLQLGDSVENEANIFFDFNAPILTNTVVTMVVEPLRIDDEELQQSISVFPNPTSGILNIQTNNTIVYNRAVVHNVIGEEILVSSEESINVSHLTQGVYFLVIETDRGILTKKIVKE